MGPCIRDVPLWRFATYLSRGLPSWPKRKLLSSATSAPTTMTCQPSSCSSRIRAACNELKKATAQQRQHVNTDMAYAQRTISCQKNSREERNDIEKQQAGMLHKQIQWLDEQRRRYEKQRGHMNARRINKQQSRQTQRNGRDVTSRSDEKHKHHGHPSHVVERVLQAI